MKKSVLALALLLVVLAGSMVCAFAESGSEQVLVRAEVLEVLSDETIKTGYSGGEILTRVLVLRVKILEGAFSGQEIMVEQTFDEISLSSAYPAKVGNRLFVSLVLDEQNNLTGYAADYVREIPLVLLVGLFVLFILFFGRKKGAKALLSLAFTCLVLFGGFFPLVIRGHSPVLLSLVSVALMTCVTMFLVCGRGKKAYAAILGCLGGLCAAGVLAGVFSYAMRLSGLINEEAAYLRFVSEDFTLDFKGLLFAAILIGASGAAMDVAVSIASSLEELSQNAPDLGVRALYQSGINIGKDIMGTMANTLILAYVGGAMHMVLLLYAYPVSLSNIFNREAVAAEILISLCGSIGMLSALPLTALAASVFYRGKGGRISGRKAEELPRISESFDNNADS